MWSRHARNEEGSVLLYTTLSLAFLFAMGGIAIDLAYQAAAKGETQRSVDAAALAGAGNLGFGSSAFPPARDRAQSYASLNTYRGGNVALGLNDANDANGDIVTGIYAGGTFTASTDGSMVNAVRCRYQGAQASVPTSFLRLLDINTLPVRAEAIGVASPPLRPPLNACVFPIGLTQCPFENAEGFNSNGCGQKVTFLFMAGASNTAAWVNLEGTGAPSAPSTTAAINAVATGVGCVPADRLLVGTEIGSSASVAPPADVISTLGTWLDTKKTSITIAGNPPNGYTGPAWVVYVPVIRSDCSAAPMVGSRRIVGWTQFAITAINGPFIEGYYDCERFDAPYNPDPAPISALSKRLRLVQ